MWHLSGFLSFEILGVRVLGEVRGAIPNPNPNSNPNPNPNPNLRPNSNPNPNPNWRFLE